MRGVYYRTEKDGTPLATPELRISATNNRTVYYDNQNAKEAALQNDEIKEGSIVLTGYADGESEVVIKQEPDWENAVAITATQINAGYTAPADGMIVGYLICSDTSTGYHKVTVNGVVISNAYYSDSASDYSFSSIDVTVKKGDVFKSINIRSSIDCSFVPFKTVAEPLTLPVNVMNNPSLPDWSRAVAITKAQLISGYTAPANGMIVGFVEPNVYGSNETPTITINDVIVTSARSTSNEVTYANIQCPVGARDIIKLINCTLAKVGSSISFVPFKN